MFEIKYFNDIESNDLYNKFLDNNLDENDLEIDEENEVYGEEKDCENVENIEEQENEEDGEDGEENVDE